jgi:hypothetical protein
MTPWRSDHFDKLSASFATEGSHLDVIEMLTMSSDFVRVVSPDQAKENVSYSPNLILKA